MPDVDITLKVIERIASAFGPIIGTFLILLCILIALLVIFAKKRMESLAAQISSKSIAEFQKGLELTFRDELLRNNLRGYLGQRSIDKKLEVYNDVYQLYFKYQKSWHFTSKTPQNEIQELWAAILTVRQKVFLSAIYLGPLIDFLLPAVVGMMDGLSNKDIKDVWSASDTKTEIKITTCLDNAAKWLTEKLVTHQDLSMYELSGDTLKAVADQRAAFVEEQFKKSSH